VAGFFTAGFFVTVSERLLTEPEQLGRKGRGSVPALLSKRFPPAVTSRRTLLLRDSPENHGCVATSGFWLGSEENVLAFRGGFLAHEGV